MKIILMMVLTADGKIAKTHDHAANWSSKADKKLFIAITKKAGCIIMGKTTYDTIGKPLPGRLNLVLDKNPSQYQNIPGQLEYYGGTPAQITAHLEDKGFKEAVLGGGAYTNANFIKAGLVDEIILTIEPKLFGQGLNLFGETDLNVNLKLLKTERLGSDSVYLHYQVLKE